MSIITVGPGQEFSTIEDAVAAANSGDTINVIAGIYTNDFISIINKSLTLQAVGGPVQLIATIDAPNGKGIIDEGGAGVSVTINGFDISGAVVPDENGAAIRYEGGSLTLNNDYIHDNQDGLLANDDATGSITINNSEFAFNGIGDGQTHNIYVGNIALLTITSSYIHDANVGHEIKSRAQNTVITGSRIFDNTSTASYSIDLPNGGNALIEGNVIEQGPNSENNNIIAYGEEGATGSASVLIASNVIVNDKPAGEGQLIFNPTSTTIALQDSQLWNLSPGQLSDGPLSTNGNTFLATRPTLDTSSTWAVGIPCFLRGTNVATPGGEVRVEDLTVGQMVRTIGGAVKRIIWIGTGHAVAIRGRRSAATPIIIRKGALSGNVPYRDLRVTKGHALYLDGVLIPVEFLVNHRSIMWDDHSQEVPLYHIELETHDVLLANGAPAESYRDDGNRWLFENWNTGWMLPAKEPCVPVLTGGAIVDAVWWRLLEQAGPRPGMPLTDDPDLHLVVNGRRIDPAGHDRSQHVFRLSSLLPEIRLVSRAGSPQEFGLARDPRLLGVGLRQIQMMQGARMQMVDANDARLVEGFYAFEPEDNIRWTNGDARLPMDLFADFTGPTELVVHLRCTTRYLETAS